MPASIESLALQYAAHGWRVFPVNAGEKTPATKNGLLDASADPDTIRSWWQEMPAANVGIRCGAPSGLVVLDVDPAKGGAESLRDLEAKHGPLPATLEVSTGGGGRHLYFLYPGRPVRNSAGTLGKGLDVRGDGGYVVAPPSVHASGQRYAWLGAGRLAAVPEWILKPSKNGHQPAGAIPESISDGQRNATLASLAGTMRRRGASQDAIEAALRVENDARCDPPLPDDEVHRIAASVSRYAPAVEPDGRVLGRPADGGSSSRLVEMSSVGARAVEWLVRPYIPIGKLTIMAGYGGVGKSILSLEMAAAVSRGHGLPGMEQREPARVLVVSNEDDLNDTMRPRLDSLGADVGQIATLRDQLNLDPPGIELLEARIAESHAVLVVLDSLTGLIAGVDMHRGNEMRVVLAGLRCMAERQRCAIVVLHHLTKGTARTTMARLLGSVDITNACRSVLLVGCAPDDDSVLAMIQTKANIGRKGKPQGFAIESTGPGDNDVRVRWTGPSTLTEATILGDGEGTPSKLDGAVEFLRATLAHGPRRVLGVEREASIKGISKGTLIRAKDALSVVPRHSSTPGEAQAWWWELPGWKAPPEPFA